MSSYHELPQAVSTVHLHGQGFDAAWYLVAYSGHVQYLYKSTAPEGLWTLLYQTQTGINASNGMAAFTSDRKAIVFCRSSLSSLVGLSRAVNVYDIELEQEHFYELLPAVTYPDDTSNIPFLFAGIGADKNNVNFIRPIDTRIMGTRYIHPATQQLINNVWQTEVEVPDYSSEANNVQWYVAYNDDHVLAVCRQGTGTYRVVDLQPSSITINTPPANLIPLSQSTIVQSVILGTKQYFKTGSGNFYYIGLGGDPNPWQGVSVSKADTQNGTDTTRVLSHSNVEGVDRFHSVSYHSTSQTPYSYYREVIDATNLGEAVYVLTDIPTGNPPRGAGYVAGTFFTLIFNSSGSRMYYGVEGVASNQINGAITSTISVLSGLFKDPVRDIVGAIPGTKSRLSGVIVGEPSFAIGSEAGVTYQLVMSNGVDPDITIPMLAFTYSTFPYSGESRNYLHVVTGYELGDLLEDRSPGEQLSLSQVVSGIGSLVFEGEVMAVAPKVGVYELSARNTTPLYVSYVTLEDIMLIVSDPRGARYRSTVNFNVQAGGFVRLYESVREAKSTTTYVSDDQKFTEVQI